MISIIINILLFLIFLLSIWNQIKYCKKDNIVIKDITNIKTVNDLIERTISITKSIDKINKSEIYIYSYLISILCNIIVFDTLFNGVTQLKIVIIAFVTILSFSKYFNYHFRRYIKNKLIKNLKIIRKNIR